MTTAVLHSSDFSVERKGADEMSRPPRLSDLLRRRDDRLLRDIGLTRRDALGVDGLVRAEWRRNREIWSL